MADQAQRCSSPPPPSPPTPVQAGKQAQQQQQDHVVSPVQAPTAQQPGQQVVHLNWSYFKPEFSGKPNEDTEAHLLHTNDWMNAYHFIEGVKVQKILFNTNGRSQNIVSFIRTY